MRKVHYETSLFTKMIDRAVLGGKKEEDFHVVFVDLEKAYDMIPKDVMWQVLEKKLVSSKYIDVIKDMYMEY